MTWTIPIYDRTDVDVAEAKTQIEEWLSDPSSATVTDLKGCLNPSDLNRIESNTEHLETAIAEIGYSGASMVHKTNWAYTDYSDLTPSWKINTIDRIINNLSELFNFLPSEFIMRSMPDSMMSYSEINDIEYIQARIKKYIECVIESPRYCGAVISGDIYAA